MAITHIPRKYKHGFILTEQELRKIVDTSVERVQKNNSSVVFNIVVTLDDHSVVETDNIDDVFSLENAGLKCLKLISIKIHSESKEDFIYLSFEDVNESNDTWNSIKLDVYSSDRDWGFLTTSELEDRIIRVKFFSFSHWWDQSVWTHVLMGLFTIFLLWIFNSHFVPDMDKSASLRLAYEAGDFKNTIEALIFLEERREARSGYWYLGFLLVIILAPIFLTKLIGWLSKVVYKPYVFHWGDEISRHDKRMTLIKGFNIVIILGVVVSVLAAFISKIIGI